MTIYIRGLRNQAPDTRVSTPVGTKQRHARLGCLPVTTGIVVGGGACARAGAFSSTAAVWCEYSCGANGEHGSDSALREVL